MAWGNAKLGKDVATYSRRVGTTCPKDCPFLNGQISDGRVIPPRLRCYAEKIQNRWTSVREAWSRDRPADFVEVLARELHQADLFRLHVGGDFMLNDVLDRDYLSDILRALRKARRAGWIGKAWVYTHAWRLLGPYRERLESVGLVCYASCHTLSEYWAAKGAGWLVALDVGREKFPTEQGGNFPGIDLHRRMLKCPEQVKEGAVKCQDCQWCPKGLGDVAFFRHV